MLTVKHIQPSGQEVLHVAERVKFKPRSRPDGRACSPYEGASDDVAAVVMIDTAVAESIPLGSFGKFYVMNEAGKTVASYDLGGDTPEPARPTTFSGTDAMLCTVGDDVLRMGPGGVTLTRGAREQAP